MIGARWAVADPRIPQAGERQTGHADQAHKEGFHFMTGNGKAGKGKEETSL